MYPKSHSDSENNEVNPSDNKSMSFKSTDIIKTVSKTGVKSAGKIRLTDQEKWQKFQKKFKDFVRKNRKALIIFCSALAVLLIVAVVAIIAANNQPAPEVTKEETVEEDPDVLNADDGDEEEEDETAEPDDYYELPDELNAEDISAEDEVTKEASLMDQDPDYSDQDVENYYDDKINENLSSGNSGLAIEIMIEKVNYLAIVEDDCDEAKSYADSIDLSQFSDEQKSYLSSYIYSTALGCDDEEFEQKWANI